MLATAEFGAASLLRRVLAAEGVCMAIEGFLFDYVRAKIVPGKGPSLRGASKIGKDGLGRTLRATRIV